MTDMDIKCIYCNNLIKRNDYFRTNILGQQMHITCSIEKYFKMEEDDDNIRQCRICGTFFDTSPDPINPHVKVEHVDIELEGDMAFKTLCPSCSHDIFKKETER